MAKLSRVTEKAKWAAQPGLQAPITAGDRQYMDGGVAGMNLDGAVGDSVALAVIPFPGRGPEQSIAALQATGKAAVLIIPDDETRALMGSDVFDTSRYPSSAESGYRQAQVMASQVRQLWAGLSSRSG